MRPTMRALDFQGLHGSKHGENENVHTARPDIRINILCEHKARIKYRGLRYHIRYAVYGIRFPPLNHNNAHAHTEGAPEPTLNTCCMLHTEYSHEAHGCRLLHEATTISEAPCSSSARRLARCCNERKKRESNTQIGQAFVLYVYIHSQ